MKKLITLLMTLVMVFVTTVPAFAVGLDETDLVIEGITYHVERSTDGDGNLAVTVTGDGVASTAVRSGDWITISKRDQSTGILLSSSQVDLTAAVASAGASLAGSSNSVQSQTETSVVSNYDLFWNYGYMRSAGPDVSTNGYYWYMFCRDVGNFSSYDYGSSAARSCAEQFMSAIHSMQNNEMTIVGLCVAGVVTACTTALTSETLVGAVAALVLACGAVYAAVGYWVAAQNARLDAIYYRDTFMLYV
jgi:hypothetical protein